MFSLDKKTAIITGGGSGIGKAISKLFAQQGAHVFIIDLEEASAADTAREIAAMGKKSSYKVCNVALHAQVQNTINEIFHEAGAIDILVNNAGIGHIGTVENTKEEDFDRLMAVNVKGMYNCMHAAVPFMKTRGGSILNMASTVASVGIPERFAYSTTKGAVLSMTLSVAKDYVQYNIRCNCISPGRVHTPFVDGYLARNYPGREQEMFEKLSKTQPIGRMAKPEEIAYMALYLCSDEACFLTGSDYPIDGGFIRINN